MKVAHRGKRKRNPKVEVWLRQELQEQAARYRKIQSQMDSLTPRRERWIKEFLERIQTRGFNVHSGILRKIKAEELHKRRKRKLRVVY